ncbi:MAG: hypothetical protein DSY80_00730 [Desulfocapsa sp.]|nr:MAG: hypothetical protein DSY80_00730 [Desulfocapsa sp.]
MWYLFRSIHIAAIAVLFLCPSPSESAALVRVPDQDVPIFHDDRSQEELNQAIAQSLAYLNSRPADIIIRMGDQKVTVQRLIQTLVSFQKLLDANLSDQELQQKIIRDFLVFQAVGSNGSNLDHTMLVTGYYQPVFQGSLEKKPPFLYPVYAPPPDLIIKPGKGGEKKQTGRMKDGHFITYWTREEIDTLGKASGNELAWLKDPLDVFFLHIQGSGLIRLGDGSLRSIHYAAGNGQPYRSIGKYMVATGRMRLEDASMETIRTYIETHPDERREILFSNPSYIFFHWSPISAAVGNLGRSLTPGRSIAVDQTCFPAAGLAFLKTRQPLLESGKIIGRQPIQRFVLVQDTGSALKGPGRVDLFQGTGEQAGLVAGSMKERGTLYFLLLRFEAP